MRFFARAVLAAGVVIVSGCYHAVVETGRPATGQVISRPWANSFIFGLVPPPLWEAGATCPNGVARVETQHSFLNSLVGGLTFGIYTPMTVMVTCAGDSATPSGSASAAGHDAAVISIDRPASPEEKQAALTEAAARAISSRAPVLVRF